MLGTYFCQALDKGTLSFSSIMGIQKDTHLVGQQYSWLGTILYMGVLVGEYPTNFLLQKLPVAKYLSANIFCWGVVIACSAACKNFGSLMTVRFLLGVFESCVQPTFIIMTSMWVSLKSRDLKRRANNLHHNIDAFIVTARLTPLYLIVVYQEGTDAPDVYVVLYDGSTAHGKQLRFIGIASHTVLELTHAGRWNNSMGRIAVRWPRDTTLAAPLPNLGLPHLRLGPLRRVVAPRHAHEGQVLQRG
jgi:hypothetical protein